MAGAYRPWQFLKRLPLPQGQMSLRPTPAKFTVWGRRNGGRLAGAAGAAGSTGSGAGLAVFEAVCDFLVGTALHHTQGPWPYRP